MPSGTSTMPRAEISPARRSSIAAPSRISSSAVIGLATGMRMRAGSGPAIAFTWRPRAWQSRPSRRGPPPLARCRVVPAAHQVRLQQLERASLSLDAFLGLRRRDVPVLDDKAPDPTEIDRDERSDERLERWLRVARSQHEVVDDPGPQVVREHELADRFGHLERGRGRGRDVTAKTEPRPGRVAESARPRQPAP